MLHDVPHGPLPGGLWLDDLTGGHSIESLPEGRRSLSKHLLRVSRAEEIENGRRVGLSLIDGARGGIGKD